MTTLQQALLLALAAATIIVLAARLAARTRPLRVEFRAGANAGVGVGRQLIVLAHGMSGSSVFQQVVDLCGQIAPAADRLVFAYDSRPFSNADPYALAATMETEIHARFSEAQYASVLLVAHSMGTALLRKVLLWGHGEEEDRPTRKGTRGWVSKVERFVSLAGINRGWSIAPRPTHMTVPRYLTIGLASIIGQVTRTGKLVLAMRRGAPFIADSRVQWIRLARRAPAVAASLPQTIHLLGDNDDLVTREDAKDLAASRDTIFVSLSTTTHGNLIELDDVTNTDAAARRRLAITRAISGHVEHLDVDHDMRFEENPSISRIVYVMHGIRDWGDWTDHVRAELERRTRGDERPMIVVNKKYGYFPMLPFLLYWDRQKNVRRFMDEYTENLARYPQAEDISFVGHSNGTYILASTLQRYATPRVARVFFAGSVVPKHYHWRELLAAHRVGEVVNVVATTDWVVALFPKLFEQVADWCGLDSCRGFLDIGAAGFRGFLDADDPRVFNLKYATGRHSTGVETGRRDKLDAIVSYVLEGTREPLRVFADSQRQSALLSLASNISWTVWMLLLGVLGGLGYLAFVFGPVLGAFYLLMLLALLNSL